MPDSSRELWLAPTHILASHHKFYPTKIPVTHHQLRHFISSAEKDLIYYVSQQDVFVLDLASHQNSLIATVPFESRCLAADLGWVCVGGEKDGHCAFIKIEKDEHDRPTCFGHDLIDHKLGGEIVNSMSIHTLLSSGKTPDEPVVLISNNDRTVKIYSLVRREVLTVLTHPVPMNFAAMSPDSQIIAAVGDSERVYFYRRRLSRGPDIEESSSYRLPKYEWELFADPEVPTGEPVFDDFSFAVTFSPSGHLCAASSQGGSISVFDMNRLQNAEPRDSSILCTFPSSRPGLLGCVRSMIFSPAPWDLLVWAEDHGKIGIADVRQTCVRRQILELTRENAEEIKLEDGTPVSYRNLDPREKLRQQELARLRTVRRSSPGTEPDGDMSIDDVLVESSRRHDADDVSSSRGLDLDARERSIAEALETTLDAAGQPPARPYSINYTSSPRWFANRMSSDANPQSPGPGRSISSRAHQPRRRSSVVLSESTVNAGRYLDVSDSRARISASPARIGDDEEAGGMSTNDLTPSGSRSTSYPVSSDIPRNNPWHVIQTALETARSSDDTSRAHLARIETALEAERQLGAQLEQQLADERQLSLLLRRQLDTQQRLLLENSSQLEYIRAAARESNARVEASLERVLERQLAHEQHFVNQRSEEIQIELRVATDYSRQLEDERDRILAGEPVDGRGPERVSASLTRSGSARTSTLPTTYVHRRNILNVLDDYSESRRDRLVHIENLQRQVRRAESRVQLAARDIQALEIAIRRDLNVENMTGRRSEGLPEAQPSQSARQAPGASDTATGDSERPTGENPHSSVLPGDGIFANRRSTAHANQSFIRATNTVPRGGTENRRPDGARLSELAGRIPEADFRLARMMFLGATMTNRMLDANGNWSPRVVGARAMNAGSSARGAAATVDGHRFEVGTTGIGFSPDARFL